MIGLSGLGIGLVLSFTAIGQESNATTSTQEAVLDAFQGTWQLVYAETDGKTAPADRIRAIRVVIEGDRHRVYFGDQEVVHGVQFTVDPTATPPATEDTLTQGKDAGRKIRGIYRLDGDTLISCVGALDADRPTDFATGPDSGRTLRIFRKVRPDEGPEQAMIRDHLIQLGGAWIIGDGMLDGQPIRGEERKQSRLHIQGDHFSVDEPGELDRGIFILDPGQSPKAIDILHTEGPLQGKRTLGIYELDGDTWRLCVAVGGGSRPTSFSSEPGSGHAIHKAKREQP